MSFLFNEILYKPLFNFLVFIYNIIPGNDFGVAIIMLTLIIRLVFMPLSVKTIVSQKKLSQLQPKIKELQEKFKNDKAAQAQAVMEIYKKEGVNPMSGCLPLIIQIPVLFALYQALLNGFNPENLKDLYGFITNPGVINNTSLGFFDLASKNHILAIAAGAFQFVQAKISIGFQGQRAQNQSQQGGKASAGTFDIGAMNKQMLYFFPVMIIIIAWNLPAGLVLYWAVTTIFSIFEQLYIKRIKTNS